jgi:hypothetical protein
MNRFAAKDRKLIDREKYLKNIDAIKARCNAYYWAHRDYYLALPKYNSHIWQIRKEKRAAK